MILEKDLSSPPCSRQRMDHNKVRIPCVMDLWNQTFSRRMTEVVRKIKPFDESIFDQPRWTTVMIQMFVSPIRTTAFGQFETSHLGKNFAGTIIRDGVVARWVCFIIFIQATKLTWRKILKTQWWSGLSGSHLQRRKLHKHDCACDVTSCNA